MGRSSRGRRGSTGSSTPPVNGGTPPRRVRPARVRRTAPRGPRTVVGRGRALPRVSGTAAGSIAGRNRGETCAGPQRHSSLRPGAVLRRAGDRSKAHADHVLRSRPLLALDEVELHPLALAQRLEALTQDRGVVHEAVPVSILRLDESKALAVVEPLHGSGHTHTALLPLKSSRVRLVDAAPAFERAHITPRMGATSPPLAHGSPPHGGHGKVRKQNRDPKRVRIPSATDPPVRRTVVSQPERRRAIWHAGRPLSRKFSGAPVHRVVVRPVGARISPV